ncbi:MAG: hypothetical protein GX326_01195 [Clostridiaceae bacterium]|nr:hypothetical protein [Clostridiaceae bacterium]
MNNNKYNYFFAKNNPNLQEKMATEQFKLSEQILDLRYQLNLTFEEIVDELNVTAEEYLDMEYGEKKISVEKYEAVILQLKKLVEGTHEKEIIKTSNSSNSASSNTILKKDNEKIYLENQNNNKTQKFSDMSSFNITITKHINKIDSKYIERLQPVN